MIALRPDSGSLQKTTCSCPEARTPSRPSAGCGVVPFVTGPVVVIPVVQAEFGATRAAVSLAFTLMMFGFGLGGVIAGKITDRFGIVPAMAISIAFLGVANVLAGLSGQLWQFVAAYFLIGLGTSATFAPLMAEASHWFERYRGLAVTIVASGNYFAGAMWPPIVNWGMQEVGWRYTHIGIGLVCAASGGVPNIMTSRTTEGVG